MEWHRRGECGRERRQKREVVREIKRGNKLRSRGMNEKGEEAGRGAHQQNYVYYTLE